MKKYLLATAAAAALIGCTTLADAQQPRGAPGGAAPPQGAQTTPNNSPAGPSSNQTIPERLEPAPGAGPGQAGQNAATPQHGAQQSGPGTPAVNGGPQQTGQSQPRGSASVKLSQDQRTKIHHMLARDRSAHIAHATFSVAVGTAIPRDVHIVVVPEDIVAIVPEYRGFDYVVVGDEILIVNPDTLRIVAIIPA